MKKIVQVSLILMCSFAFSQNIDFIKRILADVNQTKNFTIKTVPNSYYSDQNIVTDNGIELKGYYKRNKLLKLEHWVGLSAWKTITEYFFSDENELVFVHSRKFQIVNENGYLKNPKKLSESKFYYTNGKLILKSSNSSDNDVKLDYLKESKTLLNDLKISKY